MNAVNLTFNHGSQDFRRLWMSLLLMLLLSMTAQAQTAAQDDANGNLTKVEETLP
ncbi:MAG: hypothetical protein ACI37U_00640 [Bacteroides sp.]